MRITFNDVIRPLPLPMLVHGFVLDKNIQNRSMNNLVKAGHRKLLFSHLPAHRDYFRGAFVASAPCSSLALLSRLCAFNDFPGTSHKSLSHLPALQAFKAFWLFAGCKVIELCRGLFAASAISQKPFPLSDPQPAHGMLRAFTWVWSRAIRETEVFQMELSGKATATTLRLLGITGKYKSAGEWQ